MTKACLLLKLRVHCLLLELCCAGDQARGKEVVTNHQLALTGIQLEWP